MRSFGREGKVAGPAKVLFADAAVKDWTDVSSGPCRTTLLAGLEPVLGVRGWPSVIGLDSDWSASAYKYDDERGSSSL